MLNASNRFIRVTLRTTEVADAGGAIFGLISPGADSPSPVAWHHLNTNAMPKVCETYSTVFGWRMTERRAIAEHGVLQMFTWPGAIGDVGSIIDVTAMAGRHPHWLFQLRVGDLERAMALVRERKGLVLEPFTGPNGERVAVCDDPQGAAFALCGV